MKNPRRSSSTHRRVACAVTIAALTVSVGVVHAQSPAPATGIEAAKQADAHYLKGKELLKAGDVKGAYEAYKAAWELKKTFDIAANLGSLELEVGRPRDAAEHLAFAIRNYAVSTTTADRVDKMQKRLDEAKRLVGAVTVKANVDGAEILVDGVPVGRSPMADEIYLDPGTRVIEAKLAGHVGKKETIEVARASSQTVALTVAAAAQQRGAGDLPPPAAGRSLVPIFIGAGVAAVGIGLGITGIVVSSSKGSDVDRLKGELAGLDKSDGVKNNACLATPVPAQCGELDGAYVDKGSFRNVAIVGFAVAGAAAIGTLTYVLLSPSKAPVEASFGVGPGGGGVVVMGRF